MSALAAEEFLKATCSMLNSGDVDKIFTEYSSVVKGIMSKHHIEAKDVITIAFVNWVAPCMIKSEALELQANLIAMLAGQNEKSIIPILFPQLAYTKEQLYLSEQVLTTLLANRGVNFDHKFGLLFQERVASHGLNVITLEQL